MKNKPMISICVPVYNSESFLAPFLDSALSQSFENYEIVMADNHSTDRSLNILKEYEKVFPDKIFVYQTKEHSGAGAGRNLAFQKSRGAYIYWCDADDLIHPKALELLFNEAVRYNAQIVRGYAIRVDEDNGEIRRTSDFSKKRAMRINNETLISSGTFFWLELIKRELLEHIDPMPEDIILEDVRFLTLLHCHADNIRTLEFPIYYWFRRGVSTISTVSKELCLDSIEADKYILKNCNFKYLSAVQYLVASRNKSHFDIFWQFFDLFVKWVGEQDTWIYDNDLLKKDKGTFEKLHWIDTLTSIQFPNRIYVNGFGTSPTDERLEELQEKVFHDGCEIIILSEETCAVDENEYIKRAYDKGDLNLVAKYFALKNVFDNGGVYLHNNIKILNYFGFLKYQNAFFSLIDKETYSEYIFGAPAKNEAIAAILGTYSDSWDKKGDYMSLAERISIVLTAKYGVPMDGKARLFGKIFSIIPPDLSVVDTRFGSPLKRCAFEHDFSSFARDDSYVTIPRSTLRVLMTPPPAAPQASTSRGVPALSSTPSLPAIKSSREKALEQELATLKSTNTWKIMMKIRKIGDGPMGPFLKKIFHGLLKFRARFIRK